MTTISESPNEHERTDQSLRAAYEQLQLRFQRQADELCAARKSLKQQADACKRAKEALEKARKELQDQAHRHAADLRRTTEELETRMREQLRIADELRASEERYRNLIEMAPDSIATLDLKGRITSTNAAACGISGYELDDVIGKPFWKLGVFRACDIPKYLKLFYSLIRGNPPGPMQLECYSKDGTKHILESRVGFIRHDSRVVGLQVISRNITDRKRQEELLHHEQSFRNRIIERASEGLCVCHNTCEHPYVAFTVWNRRMTELTGYTMDEINRLGWYQTMYPDPEQCEKAIQRMATMREGNDLVDEEWEITRADGQRRFVLISTSVVADEGETKHVLALMHDITEAKRARETLRASEERYRLLVETIPQLAWRSSPDGLEIECNRRWYEYTGQTPAQVRAHGWLAAVHPDDLFRVIEQAAHAASNREPYEVEYRLRRASDGSYRWHLARAVPALGEDGRVTCWFGSATDIEDLKQAQEVLKQAHDAQLQRHQAELAHAARLSMMGEMAAGLAHELNQPLHAVKNYAYGSICRLQTMPQRDDPLVFALEQISEEANRAAEIIRRVKGFVQKREPQFSEVFVNSLVEDAILFTRMEFERYRATVALELAEDLPAVVGDPIQIEQAILNLVRNGLEAMDQTPEADRLLRIETMHGEDAIQVDVCDSGTGLGEAELGKIFEPFYTTKPEGMGMGLAVSRSMIQAHQGRLWATVNQTRGCTFHLMLPIGNRER